MMVHVPAATKSQLSIFCDLWKRKIEGTEQTGVQSPGIRFWLGKGSRTTNDKFLVHEFVYVIFKCPQISLNHYPTIKQKCMRRK